MSQWHLSGLNGSNPLGFLAALGTLRSMSLAWPGSRVSMRWEVSEGAWRPCLEASETIADEALIPALYVQLRKMIGHPALTFSKNLSMDPDEFRDIAMRAYDQAKHGDSCFADFVVAFACEVVVGSQGPNSGKIRDTALRTMSGSGHQHFVEFMAQLAEATKESQLAEALFALWTYSDDRLGLRWDPTDDRRYALRWGEPSGDPARTVRGANRLAVEALPLLPVMPVGRDLETTGFSQRRHEGVQWTWPIWDRSLSVDTVRSLLALKELQQPQPPRGQLWAIGVVEIYRSQRITQGKFRNFTPAKAV